MIVLAVLTQPSSAATTQPLVDLRATVSQTTAAVPAARQALRANVETAVEDVRNTVRSTPVLEPVVGAIERVREPVTSARRELGGAALAAVLPSTDGPPQAPGRGGRRDGSGDSIGDADSAAQRLGQPTTANGSRPALALPGAAVATSDAAPRRPAGAASSTSSNGGQDDDPDPGGPGATTGGVSGPLGFVLIAAVLAFLFGFAPRIISTPLRMSKASGRETALALPLERPD